MAVQDWEIREAARFHDAMAAWVARLEPAQAQDAQYQAAFSAFDRALIATITYMQEREHGRSQSGERESELTNLWAEASRAISPLDHVLSDACMMKGIGWTDPRVWKAAKAKGHKISIEDMQDARAVLNRKRQLSNSHVSVPKWFPIAGVCFAAVTVLFLMYLLLGPTIEPQKKNIFDALVAFCASASGAFLGGSAVARGSILFFRSSPIKFSAYGGIGIFIVVFLVLHYAS